jgi:hypothetical protein
VSEPSYTYDEGGVRRTVDAVRWVEAQARTPRRPLPPPLTAQPSGDRGGVLRVLGPRDATSGYYPGALETYVALTRTWEVLGAAWVLEIRGNPLSLTRYFGRRFGAHDDGTPVWVTDGCPCAQPGDRQPGPTPPPVALPCCPGGVAQALCLTITLAQCNCLNGTYRLVWNADPAFPDTWIGAGPACGSIPNTRWRFYCKTPATPAFELAFDCGPTVSVVNLDCQAVSSSVTCSPFAASGTGTISNPEVGGCCTAAQTFTWALAADNGTCAGGDDTNNPPAVPGSVVTCDSVPCTENDLPRQWTVTVAGVTNGICARCTVANGTWTLDYVNAGGCTWATPETIDCAGTQSIALIQDDAGSVRYRLTLSAVAEYQCLYANWHCCGPNTFTRISTDPNCATSPATLVATPVGDCSGKIGGGGGGGGVTGSGCCDGYTLPATLHITFQGASGATSVTLTYVAASSGWAATGWLGDSGVPGGNLLLKCVQGSWSLLFAGNTGTAGTALPNSTPLCSPPHITFDCTLAFGATAPLTATVTT